MKYLLTPWVWDPGAFFREKHLNILEVSYGLGCPLSTGYEANTAKGIIKSHVSSGVTLGNAYHTGQCCSRGHSSNGWHGDLALPHCVF